MLGGSQGLGGGANQRTAGGLWPLASAPVSPAASFTSSDGYSKYGFYSLFAGAPTFGSTLYSHNTVGRYGPALQAPGATAFHTTHKVSDSLFSATGYTFGAPTPPPGSPYSPVPVAQLEFLTKGYTTTTNSNIIIQQSPMCHPHDIMPGGTPSPKKNINAATPTPTEKDKLINTCAVRQSQSSSTSYKHQQAQYIYQPDDGATSCMLKLTTLTSSADKDCHQTTMVGGVTGCSRTNPLEWAAAALSPIHVKKEPGGALLLGDLNNGGGGGSDGIIKMEMASPVQKEVVMQTGVPSIVTANGNIPVGIAVGRQRIQHQQVAPTGILTTTHFKEVARISEIADINAAAHHAALQHQHHHLPHHHHHHMHGGGAGTTADMLATAGATTWGLMGGVTAAAHSQHCHQQQLQPPTANGTTLWTTQYPAPLPMEPLLPMSAVGLPLQLVREPTSGGFLLFPTAGIEPVQQAAAIQLWPTATAATTTATAYPTGATSSHVILPPPLPPPPPLQLLTTAHAHQHEGAYHLSTMIATTASNNTNNHNNGGLITTISNGGAHPHPHHHHQHLLPHNNNNMQQQNNGGATMFGTIEQHALGINAKLMTKDCQGVAKGMGAVIKMEEGAIVQSCHQLGTISANLHNEQANLQIFDGTSPVTHLIYQSTQPQQTATSPTTADFAPPPPPQQSWKQSTYCRSHDHRTSPVITYLTADDQCNVASVASIAETAADDGTILALEEEEEDLTEVVPIDSDVPTKQLVQDASNQTDESLSDDETSATLPIASIEVMRVDMCEESAVCAPAQQPPDFSGLDLLSNSILQHETSKQTTEHCNVEENLGGLDLLCALAEQRLEEASAAHIKPELVKVRRNAIDEEPSIRAEDEEVTQRSECNNCNCADDDDEPYKSYRTKESEREVKKFIASKAPSLLPEYKEAAINGRMNDSERDMRQQLADLQRKYKEKQRELNKLKPHHHASGSKKYAADCAYVQKKKHRKKNNNSTERNDTPLLEPLQIDVATPQETLTQQHEDTKSMEKRSRYSSSIADSCAVNVKRPRKVGRPKKLEWSSSDNESSSNNIITASSTTETIVAKKPKKSHQRHVNKGHAHSTPIYVEDTPTYVEDTRTYVEDTPAYVEDTPTCVEDTPPAYNNKKIIGPKLKAEARISAELSDEDIYKDCINTDSEIESMDDAQLENITSITTTHIEEEHELVFQQTDSLNKQQQQQFEETPPPSREIDSKCTLTCELLASDRLRVLTAMGGLFYAGILIAVQPPDVYSITLDGERGNRPHIMSREEILRDAIVEVSAACAADLTVGTRLCAYWSQQYRCLYPGSVAEPSTPCTSPTREMDKRFVAVEFDDGDNGTIAIEDIRLLPADYPIIEYDPNPLLSLSKRKRRLSTTEERKCVQTPPISSPCVGTTTKGPPQIVEPAPPENNIERTRDDELSAQRNREERKRLKKRKRDKLREKQRCQMDGELTKTKMKQKKKKKKKRRRKHKCLGEECKHKRHHKKHKKHHRRHHERREGGTATMAHVDDETLPEYPEYHIVPNTDAAVTMDDVIGATAKGKTKRIRDRQESCESRSKMSAFLPPRQFWNWSGKGYKRPRGKGRSKKEFFKAIQRGKEDMAVGDSAVFLSTGRPDRPYIGKIEAFWETCGTMVVKVKWFYHPEETNGCPPNLKYPGALFESPHVDENDVQTISHRCRVVPLAEYTATLGTDPTRYATIYDNNDIYYRAGYYDPTACNLNMENDIPLADQ